MIQNDAYEKTVIPPKTRPVRTLLVVDTGRALYPSPSLHSFPIGHHPPALSLPGAESCSFGLMTSLLSLGRGKDGGWSEREWGWDRWMSWGSAVYRSFSSRQACGKAFVVEGGFSLGELVNLPRHTRPTVDCLMEGGYWVVVVIPDGRPASQKSFFNTE